MWKIVYAVVRDCCGTVSDMVEAIYFDRELAEKYAKELSTPYQEFWVEELFLFDPEDEQS